MKLSRVLIRFLLVYLLLHVVTAGVFVIVFSRATKQQMLENTKNEMQSLAVMLRTHIQSLAQGYQDPSLVQYVMKLKTEPDFRYTVIDATGNVVADSETGNQDLGAQLQRPEIDLATTQEIGFSQRFSQTLQKPMMYLAIPAKTTEVVTAPNRSHSPPSYYVRVAAPTIPINATIWSLQRTIWAYAILLAVFTATAMAIFAANMMRPLSLFAEAARNIGQSGQPVAGLLVTQEKNEWGKLSEAFAQMQREINLREEQLTESNQRMQALLRSMIEGVLSTDGEGRISMANAAARRMLTFSQTEIIGRDLLEIVRYPELRSAIENARSTQASANAEFETLPPTRRTVEARATYLPEEPDQGVAVVLHDVTDLRALENMRQDFVANVSHELKTPLASIKAYAETLRLGALNDKNKNLEFVGQIESQAELLNLQIQDLLEIARVESGSSAFNIETVNINPLCQRSIEHLLPQAQRRQVELEFDSDQDAVNATADAEGVSTIVNNLVSNAVRYTPASGTVTVHTRTAQDWAVIEVQDTGIGISAEHQSRVFERFYRVDKARSREAGGTGLGLSIAKHLTISMGGKVELESQIGKGSTFRIWLPRV